MDHALKIIFVFLVFITGCTVITEACKIRCYLAIDDYAEYDASEIEKMMDSPYFTKDICTFLWIHGFNASMTGPAITTMVKGALNKGGWNVCVWNWVKEASSSELIGAEVSYGTKVIAVVKWTGDQCGDSVMKVAGKGLNMTCLHVYGHSLGAHVAGYCGKRINANNAEPIQRIIGVDPAGPLFAGIFKLGLPVESGDAKHVDCLHCDPGKNGLNASNCDRDAWMNYHINLRTNESQQVQPGCRDLSANDDRFSETKFCNHNSCWKVLNASFTYDFHMSYSPDYWTWARLNGSATPVTLLGEKTDTSLRGNSYLTTVGDWPYTLGYDGLRPPTTL